MAGISMSNGDGKRPLDHEIPLVPFIDLLLCCIMFLLVAAVWNQMDSFDSPLPEESNLAPPPPTPRVVPLIVRISAESIVVGTTEGVRIDVAAPGGQADTEALLAALAPFEHDRSVIVSADDGVSYARLIETMDLVTQAGLLQISIGDSSL